MARRSRCARERKIKMKTVVVTGVILGLVVVGAGGWAAWNSTAIAHADVTRGGLHVEVVAPTEPNLAASPILAVGELSDGYVHDPDRLQPPAALDVDYAYVESAWAEPEPLNEPPSERADTLVWTSLRPPTPTRLEPHDYSFGFDQPSPEQPGASGLDEKIASSQRAPADSSSLGDERGLD